LKIKKLDIVVLFFFSAAIIGTCLIWVFEERFDQNAWNSNPSMRYKMSDDIIDSELLIGKTQQEVVLILGTSGLSNVQDEDHMVYRLGKGPSFFESQEEKLVVIFENTFVIDVVHLKK